MLNADKIHEYNRSLIQPRTSYQDIVSAMADCERRGDGNYRVKCDTTGDSTHLIEVRNGVAEYV